MKNFLKKAWIFFLVMSLPAATITFFVSACYLDSDTIKPAIVCLISGSWLLWMCICNTPKEKKRRREYEEDETRDRKNAS